MVDYSTPTDSELNAEIARRLGYKVVQMGERYIRWLIQHPNGKWDSEDYGYEHLAYEALGWASDANEALALWQGFEYSFALQVRGTQWQAICSSPTVNLRVGNATPSRAIAECWLMYQDRVVAKEANNV